MGLLRNSPISVFLPVCSSDSLPDVLSRLSFEIRQLFLGHHFAGPAVYVGGETGHVGMPTGVNSHWGGVMGRSSASLPMAMMVANMAWV